MYAAAPRAGLTNSFDKQGRAAKSLTWLVLMSLILRPLNQINCPTKARFLCQEALFCSCRGFRFLLR